MKMMKTDANIENQLREGETFFSKGNIDEAEKRFLNILKNDPDNKEAFNNLGVISFQNRDLEKAIQYFESSLRLDPFYKDAVLNYLCLLNELNLLDKGIPYLEEMKKVYPEDKEIDQMLEKARKGRGDLTSPSKGKAIVEIDQAEDRDLCASVENGTSKFNAGDLSGKKILHAPFEIAGNMARITRFLRSHNVDSTSANYYDTWLKYKCDINLKVNTIPEQERFKVIDEFAKDAIDKYDIFHFHFAQSLYPDFRDLEELKQRGKKIIFHFWGSDQRGQEWIFYHQAKFLGFDPPKPYTFTLNQYIVQKIINRYADVMIGAYAIPRGIFIPGIANLSAWSLEEKGRILEKKIFNKDKRKTFFVHAPSSNWKKCSAVIVDLFNQCKNEGMPIELLYVNQLPPHQAKQIYAYADYALDQVGPGTFGLFGIEMMSWEIPVLVYHIPLLDRIRDNPPVIRITKENFKRQIEKCVEMKKSGEIMELEKRCRRWVLDHVDINDGVKEYMAIYRDLIRDNQVKQYVNKSWYQQEQILQSGFKSDFYKYMVEEGVFDELRLKMKDYDKRLYK